MQLVIVTASHRLESESARTGRYIAQQAIKAGHSVEQLDLGQKPLPLWAPGWNDDAALKGRVDGIKGQLSAATALVLVSPEYHGMASAAMKNFFYYTTAAEVGHKPALLTTVSSGQGGAYPISELRSSGFKNNRICFIPEHLIVRHAGNMFHGAEPANDSDKLLRTRVGWALQILSDYAHALAGVRAAGNTEHPDFGNGM